MQLPKRIWLPLKKKLQVILIGQIWPRFKTAFLSPFHLEAKNASDIQNHAINFLLAPDHRATERATRQYFPSPLFAFDGVVLLSKTTVNRKLGCPSQVPPLDSFGQCIFFPCEYNRILYNGASSTTRSGPNRPAAAIGGADFLGYLAFELDDRRLR